MGHVPRRSCEGGADGVLGRCGVAGEGEATFCECDLVEGQEELQAISNANRD